MKTYFSLKQMGKLNIPITKSLEQTFLKSPTPFRYTEEEKMQHRRDKWFKTI